MALSTITTLSSITFKENKGWGPINFIFPTDLTNYTINSNSFTYSGGTGSNTFKNGNYQIAAQCYYNLQPIRNLFDGSMGTYYLSGVNGGTNYNVTGQTVVYNRNAYRVNTSPATYDGGNTNGSATFSTAGYSGESFQIKFPFNYVITKIYMIGEGGALWTRSPRKLHILGSNDGSSWTFVATVDNDTTMTQGQPTEYSFTFTNTNKYKYYRFVVNTLRGGNSWDGACSLVSFRTEGNAFSL